MSDMLKLRTLSSLAKVFPDEYPPYKEMNSISVLKNEPASFQVAYTAGKSHKKDITVEVETSPELKVAVYAVELIPSNLPVFQEHDENILRDCAGLFPELLRPFNGTLDILPGQWRSLWFEAAGDKKPGEYTITVNFKDAQGELLGSTSILLTILNAELPQQSLICTHWFHTDCLSTWYKAPVFSEEYWRITENFTRTAAEHGLNSLLTPLFTPPLDTAIGGERPTVQLIDVHYENGTYHFGFEKLTRWVEMFDRCGIQYFEMSHFFTQWGAAHAPKIMATVNGEYQRIFGWDTDAQSSEYVEFLTQFSKALIAYIDQNNLRERCLFHVSDEPGINVIEAYSAASALISRLFEGFVIIDALSDYDFYEKGLVKCPVPGNNHMKPFLENNIEGLWTYYCCGQYKKVSNRFFTFPSARNRILGMQLYKNNIAGFLHWGYNFWYSRHSVRELNPFVITDADNSFPSGDAFVVYPDDDGTPLVSMRLKVFYEGLNDQRALQLLESLTGREATIELLEQNLEEPLTFEDYPHSDEWLIETRQKINMAILSAMEK